MRSRWSARQDWQVSVINPPLIGLCILNVILFAFSFRPEDESHPTVKPDWIVDNLAEAVDKLLQ